MNMTLKRIIVENHKKERMIVQPSMIPPGFKYVEDYKEPKKTNKSKKETENIQKAGG